MAENIRLWGPTCRKNNIFSTSGLIYTKSNTPLEICRWFPQFGFSLLALENPEFKPIQFCLLNLSGIRLLILIWLKLTRTYVPIRWMSPKCSHSRTSHTVFFIKIAQDFLCLVRNWYRTNNIKWDYIQNNPNFLSTSTTKVV